MARIYSENPNRNCDYGVDFFNGAAAVHDTNTPVLKWFEERGYTIKEGANVLSPWDYLTVEQLKSFAPYMQIDTTGLDKADLVAAIETTLITLMKLEITAFDPIPSIDGGTTADPVYVDATEVKAALPETVTATLAPGISVTVPVTEWTDSDNYNASTADEYTFTAVLGAIPTPFANTGSKTATVDVVVVAP